MSRDPAEDKAFRLAITHLRLLGYSKPAETVIRAMRKAASVTGGRNLTKHEREVLAAFLSKTGELLRKQP